MFASDPTLTISGWVPWIIAFGSLAAAGTSIVVFFKKVALPFAELVATMRKDFPVWRDIAETFGAEGQETISTELRALAANDEVSAANQKAMMGQLSSVIAKVDVLDVKLTETRHSIIGDYAALRMGEAGTKTLVESIVDASNRLEEVTVQLAELTRGDPDG